MPGNFDLLSRSIGNLREGKPIDFDPYGLIRRVGDDANIALCRNVAEITRGGSQGKSYSTWLVAHYGGGKSQTLLRIKNTLAEQLYGGFKVFVTRIDLSNVRNITATGFQLAIFEDASFLSSTDLTGSNPGPSTAAENAAVIGIDIATTVLSIKVPGAGILTRGALSKIKRWYVTRRAYIRKKIERLKLGDNEATELMVLWVDYSLSQGAEKWRALNEYVDRLAEAGKLFRILTFILKKANYASIVLLIDQAEKLVANRILTDTLLVVRDSNDDAGLNVFFVFAGTNKINELRSPEEYGGFARRFLDNAQSPSVHEALDGPTLDDIDRVRIALDRIRQDHPGLSIPRLDDASIAIIRQSLAHTFAQGPTPWPVFWRKILSEGQG
jgi:hypothetical protein